MMTVMIGEDPADPSVHEHSDQSGTQALWPQMIAALAAIDDELGLPADGCNSTSQTLAQIRVIKLQRDGLRDALKKVLVTREREAMAMLSWKNVREIDFSDDSDERKAHTRAMLAANEAENEARTLLLTLRT